PSLLLVSALLCLGAAIFYAAPVGAPAREAFDLHARRALHLIMTSEEMALAVCGAAAALIVVPYLLREALAEGELVPQTDRRRRAATTGDHPEPRRVRRHPRLQQQRTARPPTTRHRSPSAPAPARPPRRRPRPSQRPPSGG
ncbi:MAG: hypothetical protein J7M26_08325, partial [Armatimonadetes bacterium]|nr:hypothetical protein [Armatimonadota bacterium]